jgi:hypothetical protein
MVTWLRGDAMGDETKPVEDSSANKRNVWQSKLTLISLALGVVITLLGISESLFHWYEWISPKNESELEIELNGFVYELKAGSRVAIPNVRVIVSGTKNDMLTDSSGRFTFFLKSLRLHDKITIVAFHDQYTAHPYDLILGSTDENVEIELRKEE